MISEDESSYDTDNSNIDEGLNGLIDSMYIGVDDKKDDFKVLTLEDVVKCIDTSIREVTTPTQIPAPTVLILLNHFKWNKDRFMENLYDGDPNELFKKVGVVNPFRVSPDIERKTIKNEITDCEICYMGVSSSIMTGLECGHEFCKDCWIEYLTSKIMTEEVAETISCACYNCNIIVDFDTIMKLVTNIEVKVKYHHLILNNYVENNLNLTWCPNPKCTYAIKVRVAEPINVKCLCKHSFCFSCKENVHEPVKCIQLKKWLRKHADDLNSYNWINENTKDCPKCGVPIEKNGGCNHMTCRRENCRYQFCWICLEKSNNPLDFHTCLLKSYPGVNVKSRKNLQNHSPFYDCFIAHKKYLKWKNKLFELSKIRTHTNLFYIFSHAVDVLCNCLQTLMYSYIFSYYVIECNYVERFNFNLQNLKNGTERLSQSLVITDTYDEDTYIDNNRKASAYCKLQRHALMKLVNDGYDKNWWIFDEEL